MWGAATGPDGRIWVFWSGQLDGHGITAVTRSNRELTAFEPIQLYDFDWSYLFWLSGDGRLGPLDMLISGTPAVSGGRPSPPGGIYYARILPELSTSLSVTRVGRSRFAVKVRVTDAGDPVTDATASAMGQRKRANSRGIDRLTLHASKRRRVTVSVSVPGYRTVKLGVRL